MTDPQPGGQSAGPGGQPVRIRFAPVPGGHLHLADVRAALYDWAFARHTGGTFVLRIDDVTEPDPGEQAAAIQETLHWLGLAWDEGPDQGGPCAPYQQSERIGLYHQWAQRFLDTGYAYWCYCSPEELQARRDAARDPDVPAPPPDYDRYCRTLTPEQAEAYLAEGRRPVLRFRVPDAATRYIDLIRGPVIVEHHDVPDFVLMRADGHPLPVLATAVDDAVMRFTHIVQDEDLLPITARQVAVYQAMGLPEDQYPVFVHLPAILGEDQQKLSRRDGQTSVDWFRREGFVPEALVNYLTLLGWSPGAGRDDYGLDELVGGFDLTGLSDSPAMFRLGQLEAVNATKIRGLTPADFARRIGPFLARAGLVTEPLSSDQMWFIRQGAPLIQDRVTRLTEAPDLLAFLLAPEPRFTARPEDTAAVLTPDAAPTLKAAAAALAALPEWTAPAIDQALAGTEAAPVAVAVTGRLDPPPLPASLELLGRDRTLARLTAAQSTD